ncbi:MAG TPA: 4'-phosphopantetheinyl transferase superfamily protein [Thermomonas sp.]|nr:4'-phosphopantetheinyl transferase superfamily protein [Thermomonas sp.]
MGERGAGRVWLLPLDVADASLDGDHRDWLTEDEASRLQAMTSVARRRSFLAGHWRARALAAGWLQVDSQRIALHRHQDGRPQLLVDGAASPLSLSLSHSGDWLAIALATVPVGIDVELPRRPRDLDALARFAFSPQEVERLQRLPEAERAQAFHVTWTLKEARGKRLGEGLLPGCSRRVTASPSDANHADAMSWQLADGALSIAIDPGSELLLHGMESLGSPAHWRYHAAG